MNTIYIKRHMARHGHLKTLYYLWIRSINKAITYWVYECLTLSSDQSKQLVPKKIPNELTVRELSLDELQPYITPELEEHYDLHESFLEHAKSRNDRCFGCFSSAQLLSYVFFATQPTAVAEKLDFSFSKEWMYVFKAYTLPDWRGKHLFNICLENGIAALAKANPSLGFVTLILSENFASLKSFKSVGFQTITQFRIVGHKNQIFALNTKFNKIKQFQIVKKAD